MNLFLIDRENLPFLWGLVLYTLAVKALDVVVRNEMIESKICESLTSLIKLKYDRVVPVLYTC
jgi:hypothetical protein